MTAPLSPQCATYITCNTGQSPQPLFGLHGIPAHAGCIPCPKLRPGLGEADKRQAGCMLSMHCLVLITYPRSCALLFHGDGGGAEHNHGATLCMRCVAGARHLPRAQ